MQSPYLSLLVLRECERVLELYKRAYIAYFTPVLLEGVRGQVVHKARRLDMIVQESRNDELIFAHRLLRGEEDPFAQMSNAHRLVLSKTLVELKESLNRFTQNAISTERALSSKPSETSAL